MGGNADVVVAGAVPATSVREEPHVRLGRALYQCLGKHVAALEMKRSLAELI